MKKTIHDKTADNTQATDTGDGRIDAAKPSRRRAIKTLAATTALAATASSLPLFGRYWMEEPIRTLVTIMESPQPCTLPPSASTGPRGTTI